MVLYIIKKSPYLFFPRLESMNYKYLLCQILSHDFNEKCDFLNNEFSTRLPAIAQLKNGLLLKRELRSSEDVASYNHTLQRLDGIIFSKASVDNLKHTTKDKAWTLHSSSAH